MTDCIFCKILSGAIPAEKVYEDDRFIVLNDIAPLYRIHLLIIPKRHFVSVNEIEAAENAALAGIFAVAKAVAGKVGVTEGGYRLTVNTGRDAGQVVPHFHMHLLAGEPLRPL